MNIQGLPWPAITVCPERGYKRPNQNLTVLSDYLSNTYDINEIMSDAGIRELKRNNFSVTATHSMLRGRCYTFYSDVIVRTSYMYRTT